jgi:ABC-2 type transport system ATP-binding protein
MTTVLPRYLGPGPYAVSTHDLTKRYGKVVALDGVDLQVPEGAVYVLAGANGAGKTTLLEILLDLVRPSAGTAEVFGLDVHTRGPEARAQIGYVSARPDWGYRWMTVGCLIGYHAAFYPSWDPAYAARLTDLFALPLDRKFGALSRGYLRRVQLVLALSHRPRLLLLDEPTDGLDRVVRDELFGILAEHLAETPTTLLISTHLIYEVDPLADHLGVLRDGRLAAQVSRSRLHRLMRRYRAEVPHEWTAPPSLDQAVIRRAGSSREIHWVIWGEEAEVAAHLTRAGALLRETGPLTLDDAVLALLHSLDPPSLCRSALPYE